jgi:PAS domain S-box-containing protein
MRVTDRRRSPELEIRELRQRIAELERERSEDGGPAAGRVPALLEQLPALVWTVDRDLRLTWWRGGGLQGLGFAPEDLIGTDVYTYFGTTSRDHPAIQAHHAALEGESRNYEIEAEGRWLRAHVEPLREPGEAICGVIGVALDITERKTAERDRESLISELRDALDRLKTLSGLIPICVHCKAMRDDRGYWQQVDTFIREHSHAEFSHGICPDCIGRVLPEGR